MRKERLLTPGPTQIPERILQAMHRGAIHHRTSAFKTEFRQAIDGMRWILGAPTDPILLACSGTGAMEAALHNLCSPADSVVSVKAGAFGARWGDICRKLELKVHEITIPWGESPTEEQVVEAIRAAGNPKLFCIQHCETSTTVLHPVEQLCAAAKRAHPGIFTVVDGVSSVGTAPLTLESGALDAIVTGSQKGLMLPAGLAVVAFSDRAWAEAEKRSARSLYFDLLRERKAHGENTSAWTPATHIVLGLTASIEMFREEGLENVYARHVRLGSATRAGLAALGLEPAAVRYSSPGVSGFFPKHVDAEALRKAVRERHGVSLAGGQAGWTGTVIRIGHMGYCDDFDVIGCLGAIEIELSRLGSPHAPGVAVAAAVAALV